MNAAQFNALCADICEIMGVPDRKRLSNHGYLSVHGMLVGLTYDEVSSRMYCYADLGVIPPGLQLKAYERLLVSNQVSMSKTDGCYGIEPATGHAVFTLALPPAAQRSPQRVAAQMLACAHRAAALREEWEQQGQPGWGSGCISDETLAFTA